MKRVGIVGAGLMGNWHAERWQQLPVKIAGFYNRSPEAAQTSVARFGGEAFSSLEALVDAVDIVDVCTPTPHHKEGVLAAARGGKAVVCEKPVARQLADAEEMIAACEDADVPLFVAHVVRFFPQYSVAKAAVQRGDIGKPGVLRLTRVGTFPRPTPDTWYNSFEQGGGVVMDLSIHDIDFARWCFGEIDSVFARGLSFSGKSMTDHALISLKFKNGALGHIEGSWASPPGSPFRTALEIAGHEGILEWDASNPAPVQASLKVAEDAADKVPQSADNPLAPEDDPYYLELEHFLDHLDNGTPLRVTPQDGLMALKLSLAVIESERMGKPIALASFGGGA